MVLRFCCGALCLLTFHLSSANVEPEMSNYIPAKTEHDLGLSYGGDSLLLLEELSALLEDLEGSGETTVFTDTTSVYQTTNTFHPATTSNVSMTTAGGSMTTNYITDEGSGFSTATTGVSDIFTMTSYVTITNADSSATAHVPEPTTEAHVTTTNVPETTYTVPEMTSSTLSTTTGIPTTTTFVPSFPGPDPCTIYQFIDMANGVRSSNFYSCYSSISICDSNIKNDTWYRFEHDAGNRLLEQPIDPWFCGTQAPIYLNGKHDINEFEAVAQACATYSDDNACGWNGTVQIRRCNLLAESFLVYKLPIPTSCPLAYCVDESSRRECVPPEEWIPNEFRCGAKPPSETPNSPKSACEDAPSSGWGEWGSWSECMKTCDYGLRSRRRVCGQIPCEGLSTEFQPCNTFDCSTISEETEQGVVINLKASDANEDSLLKVIQNEEIIYEQLRIGLNEVCSKDGTLCCGKNYTGSGTKQYVSLGNVYRAQGGLTPNSDGSISLHVIAVANGTSCALETQRIKRRKRATSSDPYIPYETMYLATANSGEPIHINTGLLIVEVTDPSSIGPIDDNNCELINCILPIVLCIVAAIIILIAVVLGVTKCCKEPPDCCRKKHEESEESSSVDGEINHTINKKETDSLDNSKIQPQNNDAAGRYEVNLIVKKKSGQQQQLPEPSMSELIEAIVEDERRIARVESPYSHEDLLRSIVATYDPTIRHEIHRAVSENVQRQTSHLIDETIYNERMNYEAARFHTPFTPASPKRIYNVHGPRYHRSVADDRLTYISTKTTHTDF